MPTIEKLLLEIWAIDRRWTLYLDDTGRVIMELFKTIDKPHIVYGKTVEEAVRKVWLHYYADMAT